MANSTVVRATARMLERGAVTRAGMTRISVLAAVGAAVWFSRADAVGGLLGSAFLGAVLFCDAVRARMRANRRDALTMWLVAMLSQLREYVVYLGLVAGAVAAGVTGAWGWAAGALIALALRDSLLAARSAPPAPAPSPTWGGPSLVSDGGPGGLLWGLAPHPPQESRDGGPQLVGRLLGDTGRRPPGAPPGRDTEGAVPRTDTPEDTSGETPVHQRPAVLSLPAFTRQAMVFTQPTRFLAIAVTATLWDPRVAFLTLIVGCALAVTRELVDPITRGGHG